MNLRIVSGGQTGADRGGLDAAIEAGVPHGGWCPRGRKAEDGKIPARYRLTESASASYVARTEANVIDSDCTVVFTVGRPTDGSRKTAALADRHHRPCLCLDLARLTDAQAAADVRQWLSAPPMGSESPVATPPRVLNVAGSRESKTPGIQARVRTILGQVLNREA